MDVRPFLEQNGLGCLRSGPEPFEKGGVYIYFCLKAPARVSLTITNAKGELVAAFPGKLFAIGDRQWYFEGRDQDAKLLPNGVYFYILEARFEHGEVMKRFSQMTRRIAP
jgi:hypothetical protein